MENEEGFFIVYLFLDNCLFYGEIVEFVESIL